MKAPSCTGLVDAHKDKGHKGLNTALHEIAGNARAKAVKADKRSRVGDVAVLRNHRERSARKERTNN